AFLDQFRLFLEFAASYYHAPIQTVLQVAISTAHRRLLLEDNNQAASKKTDREKPLQDRMSLVPLTIEQIPVVEKILNIEKRFFKILIDGVTGSGKSRCYFEAIAYWRNYGNILYLVPEIHLSHQVMYTLESYFGEDVCCVHSQISPKKRAAIARLVQQKDKGVILVGARSALFMPLSNISCVIVDEEHDQSYKQTEGEFRYHARDLAIFLAHQNQCICILGSATPTPKFLLEKSDHNMARVVLTQRATGHPVPPIEPWLCSPPTIEQPIDQRVLKVIRDVLLEDRKVLVYLNQRGYTPRFWCESCRIFLTCPGCENAYFVHHKDANQLICHHCGRASSYNITCRSCASPMTPLGFGTERLAEFLQEVFPKTPQYLVDTDHVKTPKQAKKVFEAIAQPGAGIIIGTQMLSKGHDWPYVTLVVLLMSAYALRNQLTPQLAQNILQTAGRCGRHLPGRVILPIAQGEECDPKIKMLCDHHYHQYVTTYIEKNTAFFAKIYFQGKEISDLMLKIRNYLKASKCLYEWEGPFMDFPAKRGPYWRVYCIIQEQSRALRASRIKKMQDIIEKNRSLKNIFLSIEIDPLLLDDEFRS
ncbi:MAG: primosomal protein N', partial [Gammaproteobacteria bacterium]|nr:primosomal protein N' [Gammaproteobacteria bacterium]